MVHVSDVHHWTKSAGSNPPRMFCLLSRAANVRAPFYLEHLGSGHLPLCEYNPLLITDDSRAFRVQRSPDYATPLSPKPDADAEGREFLTTLSLSLSLSLSRRGPGGERERESCIRNCPIGEGLGLRRPQIRGSSDGTSLLTHKRLKSQASNTHTHTTLSHTVKMHTR